MVDVVFESWPVFSADEIDRVVDVLRGGRVNQWTSPVVDDFATAFANVVGTRHAIPVANGTLALELALKGLQIEPGDEIIVPARTFIATASAVVACGGVPVVADIDYESGNLTVETIEAVSTPKTRGIIPVHHAGWPCDMPSIMTYADQANIFVIEDCAQAHGARIRGQHVGTFGHVGAFSFCQDKIMTTGGEGGMVVTNDESVFRRMWSYKDHGKSFEEVFERHHLPGHRAVHHSFGSNWRMTAMQAAIGIAQLDKLPTWHQVRKDNAAYLANGLSATPGVVVPLPPPAFEHAWYKFCCRLDIERLAPGWSLARVIEAIGAHGVPVFSGTCPEIDREVCFIQRGWPADDGRVAAALGERSLMFLVHPTLGLNHMKRTVTVVQDVLAGALR